VTVITMLFAVAEIPDIVILETPFKEFAEILKNSCSL